VVNMLVLGKAEELAEVSKRQLAGHDLVVQEHGTGYMVLRNRLGTCPKAIGELELMPLLDRLEKMLGDKGLPASS